MGLMKREDRVQGGNQYSPGNAVVTLKTLLFDTPKGWEGPALSVDMQWDGMPEDKNDVLYGAGNVQFDKDNKTILKNDDDLLSLANSTRAAEFIDSIIDACKVAGVELNDSESVAMFEGLQVKMKEEPVIDKRTNKPSMREGKDGKEYPRTWLLVTDAIGFADAKSTKKSSGNAKKAEPAGKGELPKEKHDAVNDAIEAGAESFVAVRKALKALDPPLSLTSDEAAIVRGKQYLDL